MLIQEKVKRKLYLLTAFALMASALVTGFFFERNFAGWFSDRAPGNASVQSEVLSFLERAGWKPSAERVIVEKVGDRLGTARAVLLSRSKDGVSVPGVMFLVEEKYILAGKLFDSQTGRDVSPELFGKVPIVFDVKRMNLHGAHKRGSDHPKVVIVEYGDYGCEGCKELEKTLAQLLDNYPNVQHIYKHFPLSEGSRYLAEVAEAVSLQGEKHFWEMHKRLFSADKSGWDKKETARFVQAQLREIGLNPRLIEQTLEDGEPRKRVSRDQSEFPISQTPTLVVNGEVVVGALGYRELQAVIGEKLESKGK
jgi:predicted DsbA family dithiol-disulfide isomerase